MCFEFMHVDELVELGLMRLEVVELFVYFWTSLLCVWRGKGRIYDLGCLGGCKLFI